MRPVIHLSSSKQGAVRRGHPWIFPKAIQRHSGKLSTGELVDVYSAENESIGVGVYNEHSLYRVRMLAQTFESLNTDSWEGLIAERLRQALLLRKSLDLPNATTTAYRLFNSEGDGLSGLTIDRFNHISVVSSTAYWVEAHKEIISSCLRALLPHDKVIWLPQVKSLAQDGWERPEQQVVSHVERVLEAGVVYQVDFSDAQKTGLFLDQRENHQRIANLAAGKRVLDLYSYTGGFALHAAKAGAIKVTAVDSSAQAIVLAKKNAELNGIDFIEFIAADARNYLDKASEYDLVILDPPKLVPSQRHVQKAKNYYRFLHRELFKHMRSGSLLLTCNCSSALSMQEFTELVSLQALAVNKTARILGVFGPASCHPTLAFFPEGQYLTAVLVALV